jgi:hemolysin activation/secretion protein
MHTINIGSARLHGAHCARVMTLLLATHCTLALAVAPPPPPPDSGVLLDTVKPPPALPPKPTGTLIEVPPEARPAMQPDSTLRVTLTQVRFTGVTAVPEAELQKLVKPYLGRELSFADLDAMAGKVTRLYRAVGYFIARAYLPQQQIKDGSIEILVIEGHIGKINVKYKTAGPRIPDSELAGFIRDAIPASRPVTVPELERGMLLENDLPNVSARATLTPGASVGSTDLVLEANQTGWFSKDTLEIDNAGSRYTGAVRSGGSVNVASPAGLGDLLSARVLSSFDGFNYARLSWTTPVTYTGLRLGVSGTYTDYRLGGPLEALGDHGNARVFSVFSVYPLIRSRLFNLYQTGTYEHKTLYDTAYTGTISDKEINLGTLGLSGDEQDGWGGGGLSTFSASLGVGHLDLLSGAADVQADAQTAHTAGSYHKLNLEAMRQQRLGGNWVLYTQVTAQLASKNLDSSESFAFGGPSGVRAYPVGEAPADQGSIQTVELRYNMAAPRNLGSLQWQLFYDHGDVKLHKDAWATYLSSGAPDSYQLSSLGLGGNLYREDSLLVNVGVAHKIGSNPDPGLDGEDADARRLSTRFWVQLVKYW